MRDVVDELDRIGQPPLGDLVGQEVDHLFRGDVLACLLDHEQHRALVPLGMHHPDGGSFGDRRVAHRGVFEFDRADPFAARLDHVLGAVGDLHRAVGMEDRHVAGVEPALGVDRVFLGLEIALHHPWPADVQRARAFAVTREDLARIVEINRAQFHAENRAALLHRLLDLLIEGELFPVARRPANRADRRGFGHAPGMLDARAVLHQPLDHEARRGRPADGRGAQLGQFEIIGVAILEMRQPYRRHTRRIGHAFGLHHFVEDRGIVDRAEDEFDPCHRTGVG